jgi:hypothetical protein
MTRHIPGAPKESYLIPNPPEHLLRTRAKGSSLLVKLARTGGSFHRLGVGNLFHHDILVPLLVLAQLVDV